MYDRKSVWGQSSVHGMESGIQALGIIPRNFEARSLTFLPPPVFVINDAVKDSGPLRIDRSTVSRCHMYVYGVAMSHMGC